MNYAQTHHIGNNQYSRRTTTEKITPPAGRVRKLATKTKDSERNTERQTEISTQSNVANGFLKCRFLPKKEEIPTVQDYKVIEKTERDFYKSLSNLAEQYDIEPMQTKDFEFPYNLALAMWDIENKMNQVDEDWNRIKLLQNNEEMCFAREDCFSVTPFYFIPIVPLFQMLKNPKRKKNAQLLLSVCSYLYQIADVPYYRQQHSYLYWIYEMHEEWIEQDETEEDMQELKCDFAISKIIGDKIEQKLFNRKNLEVFEQRLNSFESHTEFDQDCYKVAFNAFALYSEYPTTIFRNRKIAEEDTYNADYENSVITMDKYISFVADTKGSLYENIEQSINVEFNEYGSIEEPTIYTPINGTEMKKADFDFEHRIFSLLDDLYCILTS